MKLDQAIIEQMEKDLAKVKTLTEQILEEELNVHLAMRNMNPRAVAAETIATAIPKSN